MFRLTFSMLAVGLLLAGPHPVVAQESANDDVKQIKALLVTGGCCHDYVFQAKAMQLAAAERGLNVQWTVVNEGGKGTKAKIKLYDNKDWGMGSMW